MAQASCSPKTGSNGLGALWVFFLGSSIPTGAQTVAVTASAQTKAATAITLTGAADTELVDCDNTIDSASQADPTVTLSAGGRDVFAALTFISGHSSPGSTSPFANWTARQEHDYGSDVGGVYSYNTIGTSDVSAGYTATAEVAVMIAVAVSEVAAAGDVCPALYVIGGHQRMLKRVVWIALVVTLILHWGPAQLDSLLGWKTLLHGLVTLDVTATFPHEWRDGRG
jgi:hypothetical protein